MVMVVRHDLLIKFFVLLADNHHHRVDGIAF